MFFQSMNVLLKPKDLFCFRTVFARNLSVSQKPVKYTYRYSNIFVPKKFTFCMFFRQIWVSFVEFPPPLSCPLDLKSPFVFFSFFWPTQPTRPNQPWRDLWNLLFLMSSCQRKICAGGKRRKEEEEEGWRHDRKVTEQSGMKKTICTCTQYERFPQQKQKRKYWIKVLIFPFFLS